MALSKLETPGGEIISPIQASFSVICSVALALAPVAAIPCAICFLIKKRIRPSSWALGSFVGMLVGQLGVLMFQNGAHSRATGSGIMWTVLGSVVGVGVYAIMPGQPTTNEVQEGVCACCSYCFLLPLNLTCAYCITSTR